ncbi:MAG: hypothetical protein IH889_07050 [Planctomycetes bacterium]|nr:hypothetical protein [Planctomycetota bacterium]
MNRAKLDVLRFVPLGAPLWVASLTGIAAGQPTPAPDGGSILSAQNRLLRQFDFEEAEHAPYTMPINFYRYIAADQGFPPFGRMQLTNGAAHHGNWSFGFELDGGSLSARVPTAVIPVFPGGDWVISAWIRTDGLTHARARLAAWLHDTHGNALSESRAQSPLVQTHGRWQRVSVEVRGDDVHAADLVVELQLLQPQQFTWTSHNPDEPLLQDVSGRAWFDDVAVWQRPRIELSTDSTGNVVAPGETPTLNVMVRDLTTDRLTAHLRVEDLDAATVHEETFALPAGTWLRSIDLGRLDGGWYRAVLEVARSDMMVASQTLNFVVLPESATAGRRELQDNRFGVLLPPIRTGDRSTAVELTRLLGIGSAVIPLSIGASGLGPEHEVIPAVAETIREMRSRNIEITVALPHVSRPLAEQLGIDSRAVLQLVGSDPANWPDKLGEALMTFGLNVQRWQIGVPGTIEGLPVEQMYRLVEAAAASLADYVPEPIILVPWPGELPLPALPPRHGYWITLPYQMNPESLAAHASGWPIGQRPIFALLHQRPADQEPPGVRVIDLVLRALHGWRAGLQRMVITAPWTGPGERRGQIMPDPSFGVWRVLAQQLDGRAFVAELPMADPMRCWILSGPGEDETALVAWCEPTADDPTDGVMEMLLAEGHVDVVDAFGNRRTVQRHEGLHSIALGPRPVFIEHVDGRLARFRAAVAIRPGFIPARSEVHDAHLVLANPWDATISGTIRIRPPAGWRITPRLHRFLIRPDEEMSLPISLVFGRSTLPGHTRVEAQIEMTADRDYRLQVHADLEVGMMGIEFSAQWHVAKNDHGEADDLIITQYVTNRGDQPVNLDAFVLSEAATRLRRAITALDPGQTAVRTFRLTNGVFLLAGKQVRLGVIERDGTARLNRVLEIPPLPAIIAEGLAASDDAE